MASDDRGRRGGRRGGSWRSGEYRGSHGQRNTESNSFARGGLGRGGINSNSIVGPRGGRGQGPRGGYFASQDAAGAPGSNNYGYHQNRTGGYARGTPQQSPRIPWGPRSSQPSTQSQTDTGSTAQSMAKNKWPGLPKNVEENIKPRWDRNEVFPGKVNEKQSENSARPEDPIPKPEELPGPVRESYGRSQAKKENEYVITNHLQVTSYPPFVYEYEIGMIKLKQVDKDDQPQIVKSLNEKRRAMEAFETQYNLKDKDDWATDFKYIWSIEKRWPDGRTNQGGFQYRRQKGEDGDVDEFPLTLHDSNPISLGNGPRDLVNVGGSGDSEQKIRILNAFIMRHVAKSDSNILKVGANKFFLPYRHQQIGDGFASVRGYYTSIRPGAESVLLNINTTTSAFFDVPQLVSEFIDSAGKKKRAGKISEHSLFNVQNMLKGITLRIACDRKKNEEKDEGGGDVEEIDVNAEENRTRQFMEFSYQDKPFRFVLPAEQRFWDAETNQINDPNSKSILDHFGDEQITRHDLPCVNLGAPLDKDDFANTDWYPPEFLEIHKNQKYNKVLPKVSGEAMMNIARHSPAENLALITQEGIPLIKFDTLQSNGVGITVDQNLLRIPAHQLEIPTLSYEQGKEVKIDNASWRLDRVRLRSLSKESKLDKVRVLNLFGAFQPESDNGKKFLHDLMNALKEHQIIPGSGTDEVNSYGAKNDNHENYESEVREAFKINYPDSIGKQTVLVMLPDKDYDRHAAIKKIADSELGLRTVCCTWKKIAEKMNPNRGGVVKWPKEGFNFCANLALKYQIKAGESTHHVKNLTQNPGMIILGADVTHPGPGSAVGCPSIASVVGSVDENKTTFLGSMRLQAGRQEIIEDMADMVCERLLAWSERNKPYGLPESILVYRDGVSESQYMEKKDKIKEGPKSIKFEVKSIKEGWESAQKKLGIQKECAPITFVVVGKRHHTRFYPSQVKQSYETHKGLNGNLQAGYVVDQIITHPFCYDFFLQSHVAVQGTARSAHYFVIENGNKISPDELHNITYALCYNYARATKGVSYCAPAYYADRLCDRGRRYLWGYFKGWKDYKNKFQKNDEEKRDEVNGDEAFRKRVAGELAKSEDWNPARDGQPSERKNPWHPNLDNVMFYL